MKKKKILIALIFLLIIAIKLHAQSEDPWGGDPTDPGGDLPIPGVLYFLVALLGVGFKKIYNARKKN
jgi:hypothetical protein